MNGKKRKTDSDRYNEMKNEKQNDKETKIRWHIDKKEFGKDNTIIIFTIKLPLNLCLVLIFIYFLLIKVQRKSIHFRKEKFFHNKISMF